MNELSNEVQRIAIGKQALVISLLKYGWPLRIPTRDIEPRIESEFRIFLKEKADNEAIHAFAENLCMKEIKSRIRFYFI